MSVYSKNLYLPKNWPNTQKLSRTKAGEFVLSWFAQLIVLWLIKLCIIKSHVVEDK